MQNPNDAIKIKLLDGLVDQIMSLPDSPPKAEVENPAPGVDPVDGGMLKDKEKGC